MKKMCSEFKTFCLLQLHESVNNKCMRQTATENILRLLLLFFSSNHFDTLFIL